MKKKTARKKPAVKAPPRDIDRLLACVEMMVVALEKHFGNHPKDLDEKRLERIQVAMTACHNVLARNADQGDWRAVAALVDQTRIGCECLHDLSKQSALVNAVKAVAATHPNWPVLVSQQKKSLIAAREYLARLDVGTTSNPPTAGMNAAREMRWRNCAVGLIDKIDRYRSFLTHTPDSPFLQALRLSPGNLPEAEKWGPLVLALPPRDGTKETRDKWWSVAEQMLDFPPLIDDQIKEKVKDDFRKPESYARREVKRAFYKLFR